MTDDRHDRVSRRAYELWQEEGGEHGRHEDHWHRASRELEETAAAPDGTTLTVPAPAVPDAPEAAKPARKRAAPKPKAEVAPTPAAKAPTKPRKPKAK